jgi:hypothetical protein
MELGHKPIHGTRNILISITLVLFLLNTVAGQSSTETDSDHDGLTDRFEQTLLDQFRPTFMISAKDCAGAPARFQPDLENPRPLAADGTIYGQAFPLSGSSNVEIHYYTLWEKDCGRNGHPFDVEHVSVIVSNKPATAPKALYWYAGAHEDTVCDISSGARAEAIDAEKHGPRVWSSAGKHALYFRKAMCGHGCGADSCENDVELPNQGVVINLGELKSPSNGALWVASAEWPLSGKMDSDFPDVAVTRLKATPGDDVITLRGNSSFRGTIQGSEAVLDGAAIGAQHTGAALGTANDHTSTSLGKASRATGRSLRKAWNAVFGRREPKGSQ